MAPSDSLMPCDHKQKQALRKKLLRKRRRQLAAAASAPSPISPAASNSENADVNVNENENEADDPQRLAAHELWLKREAEAHALWLAQQAIVEAEKARREEAELRIRAEWEQQQKAELEVSKKKQLEEAEKKQKQEALLKEATAGVKGKLPDGACWKNPEAPAGAVVSANVCSFFMKTGCCRFGERCSRVHEHPAVSPTLLIPGMYSHFSLERGHGDKFDSDIALEYDEGEFYDDFCSFYSDVLPEFKAIGRVMQFKVCCNMEPHLRGNVYIQYESEEDAQKAYSSFNGRWYAGRQLSCSFAPVTKWKPAICGLFHKNACPKGNSCNFLHVFKNPTSEFRLADMDVVPRHYSRASRDVHERQSIHTASRHSRRRESFCSKGSSSPQSSRSHRSSPPSSRSRRVTPPSSRRSHRSPSSRYGRTRSPSFGRRSRRSSPSPGFPSRGSGDRANCSSRHEVRERQRCESPPIVPERSAERVKNRDKQSDLQGWNSDNDLEIEQIGSPPLERNESVHIKVSESDKRRRSHSSSKVGSHERRRKRHRRSMSPDSRDRHHSLHNYKKKKRRKSNDRHKPEKSDDDSKCNGHGSRTDCEGAAMSTVVNVTSSEVLKEITKDFLSLTSKDGDNHAFDVDPRFCRTPSDSGGETP